jgi:hypothetical protein
MSAPRMNAGLDGAPESTAASAADPNPLSGRALAPALDPELDEEPAPELEVDPETPPDAASVSAPELEASKPAPEPDPGPELEAWEGEPDPELEPESISMVGEPQARTIAPANRGTAANQGIALCLAAVRRSS